MKLDHAFIQHPHGIVRQTHEASEVRRFDSAAQSYAQPIVSWLANQIAGNMISLRTRVHWRDTVRFHPRKRRMIENGVGNCPRSEERNWIDIDGHGKEELAFGAFHVGY